MGSNSLSLLKENSFQSRARRDVIPLEAFKAQGVARELTQQLLDLREKNPDWLLPFLTSLQSEKNSAYLLDGLVQVGVRLKGEQYFEAAQFLLGRLAQEDIPAAVRRKAEREIDAVAGKGSFGMRVEFLSGRLLTDITDAKLIVPMLGGVMAGQMIRTAVSARLLAAMGRGSASWMTRGLGLELTAGSAGFLGEVGSFAGLSRALTPMPNGAFSEDLARAALTIGALKISGLAGRQAELALAGPLGRKPGALLSGTLSQGSAFLGLTAAHKVEERLGLRPRLEGATFALDTLASLLTLGIGAHLGSRAMGEGFGRFQRELAIRPRSAQHDSLNKSLQLNAPLLAVHPMGAKSVAPWGQRPLLEISGAMMSMEGDGGKKNDGAPREGTRYESPTEEPEAPADPLTLKPTMKGPPPVKPDPYRGAIIDGRYKVGNKLGEGGMGTVYEAMHQTIHKKVAIKILKSELAQDKEITERFLNEAKASSMIRHPHIIDVSDYGVLPDGAAYFVMEFLEGVPLSKLIDGADPAHPQPVPVPRILHIGRQVAEGLAAAHKAGIVHRDLKPDNIFLINRGSDLDFAKILDFGIARVNSGESKLTLAGAIFGTPAYMSPERAAGVPGDPRGELYSYGVILYELATGKVPFEAPNYMGLLTMHLHKAPTPLRDRVADIPPEFEAIVLRCLLKHPEERYQTMEEVVADLDKLKAGMIPEAVSAMKSRSRSEFMKKNWPYFAGVGGVSAGALILAAIYNALKPVTTTPIPTTPSIPTETPPVDASPPPEPSKSVQLKDVILKVEPGDAVILMGDNDIATSPLNLQIEEGTPMEVEVRRKGYKTQKITIDGTQAQMTVRLERDKGGPRPWTKPSGTPSAKPKNSGGSGEIPNPWK